MTTKQVISWILIVVVLFGLLWLTGKNRAKNKNQVNEIDNNQIIDSDKRAVNIANGLAALETFYDFGTISMKNGDVSKVFKVTNNSGKDILFPDLTTSCMCTAAFFVQPDGNKRGPFGMPGMGFVPKLNEVIKAGESADIEVVYNPNAHGPAGVGRIDRFVFLKDSNGTQIQFEIKANVTP